MAKRINTLSSHLTSGSAPLASSFGKVGSKSDDDVVVVSALRTAIGKARKGSFKDTTPDDLLVSALKAVIKDSTIDPKIINDIAVGNVQTGGAFASGSRIAQFRADIPFTASLRAVNRQCSSGLQAVASIAADIRSGYIDVGIGAGVESMTNGGSPSDPKNIPPINFNETMTHDLAKQALTPMGITSENVAERYGITRKEQDEFAAISHAKALNAQKTGRFKDEIIPTEVNLSDKEGNEKRVVITKDDGPRAGTTAEGLSKLRGAFKKDGTTTAGNASQVSDGAAAVLLMKRSKAKALGLEGKILGIFRGFKVSGVAPDIMGIGPAVAIPDLLDGAGLKVSDVDVYEINEAFASQAVYCVKKLGIPVSKVNPNGGAIALGHPLGMTGARMVATLLHEMKKQKKEGKKADIGVVSMCIGTGMGAAGLFEVEN